MATPSKTSQANHRPNDSKTPGRPLPSRVDPVWLLEFMFSEPSASRSRSVMSGYGAAAVFSLDKARTFTRTLAGLAAALIISPLAGLRTKVPALRAGTFRSETFRRPGNVNSPTPRGCTEPKNKFSKVA